jgi:hypothetical protein
MMMLRYENETSCTIDPLLYVRGRVVKQQKGQTKQIEHMRSNGKKLTVHVVPVHRE